MLRQMQSNDEIVAVVTGIRSCSLFGGEDDPNSAAAETSVAPGDSIVCEMICVPRRNGRVLECYQSLGTHKGNRILAAGRVTLMLLNATTRKPIRGDLPSWLLDRFLPVPSDS